MSEEPVKSETVQFTVKKAEKDTLSDGSEVLMLEIETADGRIVHDVIQTQEKLDQFLVSIGHKSGSMKLRGPH